jgi:predicted O-methyltransferase YrrM
VRAIAPEAALRAYRAARVVYRARRLAIAAERINEPARWVDLVFNEEDFRPLQVRGEITALLERVAVERPARVLEIGSALGGTAFLFARVASPDATLVLVDRAFERTRCAAIRQLGRRGQRITCLRADSQAPATASRVATCFGGVPVDFLFIDADHTYQGVVTDLQNYSVLVRKGGLIAFHDIVPDNRTRFGRQTPACAGEVFRFWEELKSRCGSAASEYVDNPIQDGAGIGLLRWRGAPSS